MAALLGDDDSLGQEAAETVVEDLKFDLALLNAALKDLNKNWDFTALVTPLLSDQGPALAVAPKLKRQIDRMTKLRDEFQKKQAERTPVSPDKPAGNMPAARRRPRASNETPPAPEHQTPPAPEQTVGGLVLHPLTRRGPRAAQTDAHIEVSEVLPRWGEWS
jgi:hypothetical protein